MHKKIVIIGASTSGVAAATRLRRLNEDAQIILIEKADAIALAKSAIPYYLSNTLTSPEQLLMQSAEELSLRFNIDVRLHQTVTALNTSTKTIQVSTTNESDDTPQTYEELYDELIIATGSGHNQALVNTPQGVQSLSLSSLADISVVKEHVLKETPPTIAILGNNYFALELATHLTEGGLPVYLFTNGKELLPSFDAEFRRLIEDELAQNKLVISHASLMDNIETNHNTFTITTETNDTILANIVFKTDAPTESLWETTETGHILVDDYFKTKAEHVYAIGSIAMPNRTQATFAQSPEISNSEAINQAYIVADAINGSTKPVPLTRSFNTQVVQIFDAVAARTGQTEEELKEKGTPYTINYAFPQCHAPYCPGSSPLTLKLIAYPNGKILGAQAFGFANVEKQIDIIATAMKFKGTVEELATLDLSSGPAFSTPLAPVNILGHICQNNISQQSPSITPQELNTIDLSTVTLLDVRTVEEFQNGHLPQAINIPVDELRNRLHEIPTDKPIIVNCQVGLRGYIGTRILRQNGFDAKNITGGYKNILLAYACKNLCLGEGNEPTTTMTPLDEPNENVNTASIVPPTTVASTATTTSTATSTPTTRLDACGLSCPGPLMAVKKAMDALQEGDILEVVASDPGFYADVQAWSKHTHNTLLDLSKSKGIITALIQKGMISTPTNSAEGKSATQGAASAVAMNGQNTTPLSLDKDNKTIVVFSGDLDKAIASFIIANGAASMGKKVTMFFTFWGLNILRRNEAVPVKKGFMDSLFGWMMPRGSKKLPLSQMNMLGMGSQMIRMVMKNKNIASLEELIQAGIDNGIEIVACQMSMDVMGIRPEELIDGVKIGGVGYYLGEAEDSNVNLFI